MNRSFPSQQIDPLPTGRPTDLAWASLTRSSFIAVRVARSSRPCALISIYQTLIRSEVAGKVTATQQDDQELVRRERMAIDEIRSLLAEVLYDSD